MDNLEHALTFARKLRHNRIQSDSQEAKRVGAMIYFIEAGGYVKVGISSKFNIKRRLYAIRINSPFAARILRTFDSDSPKHDELELHKLLRPYRVHGEWFKLPVDVVTAICCCDEASPYESIKTLMLFR